MGDLYESCTQNCERMPECTTCHLTKPPRGRSVPMEAANGYCGWDCPGYCEEPLPGHLWPGELARIRGEEGERG